ncbi:MAG: SRPBCC domain-containing protein [Bacteroidota bacterium]
MSNTNFTTTLVVPNSPSEVYTAINNVGAWWQGEITGKTHNVGDVFDYRMKTFHFSKQKVTELIPDKRVVWEVTDSELSFTSKKDEWTGTQIIFEIAEVPEGTQLIFTHKGLVPAFECYGGCSNGWEMLIQESLASLITSGKGVEVF